jgi:protein-L-isoaspartate(D-aspartate) O-methyltransferase
MDVSEQAVSTDDRAAALRSQVVAELITAGSIRTARVEAAMLAVPREAFAPAGTPLEEVYAATTTVPIKRDDNGTLISTISAPSIQAWMIESAALTPGMSVLEIGSGGYNAALLAEVVGTSGRVVSVDIDPDVTANAERALHSTGYLDRVTVVTADGEHRLTGHGVFDRILVTVGAWDIAPVWLDQLAPDGVVVVPLRLNGIFRTIAFRRVDGHLESIGADPAGFVLMQGAGARDYRVLELPDRAGRRMRLRFDQGASTMPFTLDGVLEDGRCTVWSGVSIGNRTSFAGLHLWLACHMAGFCKVDADQDIAVAGQGTNWFPFGAVVEDSLAVLTVRPLSGADSSEFGASGFGPGADAAAEAMVAQIRAWDRIRSDSEPTFAVWPVDTPDAALPAGATVLNKTNCRVTITWPTAAV